nr:ATP-binding protein [Pigmentiphaga litoralis]
MAGTIVVTFGLVMGSLLLYSELQEGWLHRSLPKTASAELARIEEVEDRNSARFDEILREHGRNSIWLDETWLLFMALLLCLPAGLAAGFWLSRVVTQPLNSIAQAANRVALGDLGVRAQPVRQRGELAELVRDFNLMTDSLENLERERRATAAAISHELRTPLAVLRARLYAIYDDVIPGTPQELRRLLDQVEHLGRLVDDVHTLSLADAGRLSLHRSDIDLSAACAQLLSTYAGRIADHNVRAEYRTDIVPVHANADPDRINQILSNLIENALRYAASGEWLEIAVHRHDDKAVLTVTDRGPGLPEDVVAHLFERFHRTDLSRSRETGGSGLGLAIVQTLVIQQGGQVTAERPAEGGTRFRVALPAA